MIRYYYEANVNNQTTIALEAMSYFTGVISPTLNLFTVCFKV